MYLVESILYYKLFGIAYMIFGTPEDFPFVFLDKHLHNVWTPSFTGHM